jgi:hypothetical protein
MTFRRTGMLKKMALTALLLIVSTTTFASDVLNSETLYWENDSFGLGRRSDRFYTNGARITVGLNDRADKPHALGSSLRRRFCRSGLCGDSQPLESLSLTFGQNFYTPERITLAAPQPDDRPWAGWLYGGVSENIVDAKERILNSFEVQVGILGPGAGAQATQKYIHNDLGFSDNDPQGWHNQLKNEPTLDVMWQHSRRFGSETLDIVPKGGVMLGSPQTFVNAGATVRLGHHMTGFPVGLIVPAAVRTASPPRIEFYVFAGGEVRWVPFNATLDGGLFRNGPAAHGPKRVVTDFRRGASVRWRWLRLTYSVIDRSREFDVPAGRLGSHRFGAFALSMEPFSD